jgi:hypothetical protein
MPDAAIKPASISLKNEPRTGVGDTAAFPLATQIAAPEAPFLSECKGGELRKSRLPSRAQAATGQGAKHETILPDVLVLCHN